MAADKKAPPRKKTGRPSKKTPEVVKTICDQLASGRPLTEICREIGIGYRTVQDWMTADEAVSADIARAREQGYEAIAASCIEIADDGTNDWMERKSAEGDVIGWALNGEHVQRSKLRIETRLKLLAKWYPARYGDKLEIESNVTIKPVPSFAEMYATDLKPGAS